MSKKSNHKRKQNQKALAKIRRRNYQPTYNNIDHFLSDVNPDLLARVKENDDILKYRIKSTKKNYNKKASEILLDFAMPFFDGFDGDEELLKFIIEFAIIAWNISVSPPDLYDEIYYMAVEDMGLDSPMEGILQKLIERKQSDFDKYNFFIKDFEIAFFENGDINLSVAAISFQE